MDFIVVISLQSLYDASVCLKATLPQLVNVIYHVIVRLWEEEEKRRRRRGGEKGEEGRRERGGGEERKRRRDDRLDNEPGAVLHVLVVSYLVHLDLELCCLMEDVENDLKILLELSSNS